MILLRFGKWSNAADNLFIWERLYLYGHKWTPLCKIKFRYLKTLRECNHED